MATHERAASRDGVEYLHDRAPRDVSSHVRDEFSALYGDLWPVGEDAPEPPSNDVNVVYRMVCLGPGVSRGGGRPRKIQDGRADPF
jgi:hypothetical protein